MNELEFTVFQVGQKKSSKVFSIKSLECLLSEVQNVNC